MPFVLCTTLLLLANCTNGGCATGNTASALNCFVADAMFAAGIRVRSTGDCVSSNGLGNNRTAGGGAFLEVTWPRDAVLEAETSHKRPKDSELNARRRSEKKSPHNGE